MKQCGAAGLLNTEDPMTAGGVWSLELLGVFPFIKLLTDAQPDVLEAN